MLLEQYTWITMLSVNSSMGTWLFPSDHAQLMLHLTGYFSEKYHGNMVTHQVFSVVALSGQPAMLSSCMFP
jgi:hypothetical protein